MRKVIKRNPITKIRRTPIRCKFCGETIRIVRYGNYKGDQRYLCRKCGRKFADNDALPYMKTPVDQVSSALSTFWEGMSLEGTRRHLQQTYNNYPSDSTIYSWIIRFTKKAVAEAKDYQVQNGNTWVADETVLRIGGENTWLWDTMDAKTRFLLSSHLSETRTTRDAETLISRAARHAAKPPKVIITDKLAAYLDGIERVFGADTQHILSKGFRKQPNTNLIERLHGTIKSRTKVMRGMQNKETAKLIMDGWLVNYNFFRPHEALGGKTPAQAAKNKVSL